MSSTAALREVQPSDLSFRPMMEADIPTVEKLAHHIWNAYYPPIIGQTQTEYMNRLFNSAESLKRQTAEMGYRFLLAECEGKLAGYAATKEETPGRHYLSKFYVDTDCHRQGIGGALMQHLVQVLHPASLFLHVNRDNRKAIGFYEKMGFFITGTCVTDIGSGFVMDDLVMTRDFS